MSIHILEYPHGACDNILSFVCYHNLARYLETEVYLDWFKSFVNFPLRPKFRQRSPKNIPHYNHEYFFTNLDKEEFVETLRGRNFAVSSMDWAGVPLLTYLLSEGVDVYQTVADTTSLFFNEYCDLDMSKVEALRNRFCERPLVGVHVRYGDSIIAEQNWKLYETAISDFYSLLRNHIEEPSTIFLVSDCKKQDLIDYVKNKIGSKHDYISYSSKPKHSMHTVYDRNDWDDLLFDILFLSKCDRIYASPNSNVSRLAIFLAYAKNPKIPVHYICPFSKTVEKVDRLPCKKYNAWKFDGQW